LINESDNQHRKLKRWTKSCNLFSRKYIFLPFNQQQHWSLFMITGCDTILSNAKQNGGESSQLRGILCLDSLWDPDHKTFQSLTTGIEDIVALMYQWLNIEFNLESKQKNSRLMKRTKHKERFVFNMETFPLFRPKGESMDLSY